MSDGRSRSAWRPYLPRLVFTATALATAALAVATAWRRLFTGVDLQDESYSILVPWRWALGDRPFEHEQNLAQIPGFLMYPLTKLFAVLRDSDVTGLVLYERHLYLVMTLAVAAVVFLALRRLTRWELALLIAILPVSFVFWRTSQLTSATMAAAALTVSAVCGLRATLAGGARGWAIAAGAGMGAAVIAHPTLLFVTPFYAVFLAFALDHRTVAMVAEGRFLHPPNPLGPPTGEAAWRVLSGWALGVTVVLGPAVALIVWLGGDNLVRCWDFTVAAALDQGQLTGAYKALEITRDVWLFIASRPIMVIAVAVAYMLYRRRTQLGRAVLVAVPAGLWLAGQEPQLEAAGLVIAAALAAPLVFLLVPREQRQMGARLLIWIWAPAMIAGAMTAYTSVDGYEKAAIGLFPTLLVGALFLAWALDTVPIRSGSSSAEASGTWDRPAQTTLPWLSLIALVALVAATIALQLQYQQRHAPFGDLEARFDSGPWWGIAVTPDLHDWLEQYARDLEETSNPGDSLLVFYGNPGLYLAWPGSIAANSGSLWSARPLDPLPASTVRYYRRRHEVPSLVVHALDTTGLSKAQLQDGCGGLKYPVTKLRACYAIHRRPAGASTDEILSLLAGP